MTWGLEVQLKELREENRRLKEILYKIKRDLELSRPEPGTWLEDCLEQITEALDKPSGV